MNRYFSKEDIQMATKQKMFYIAYYQEMQIKIWDIISKLLEWPLSKQNKTSENNEYLIQRILI